ALACDGLERAAAGERERVLGGRRGAALLLPQRARRAVPRQAEERRCVAAAEAAAPPLQALARALGEIEDRTAGLTLSCVPILAEHGHHHCVVEAALADLLLPLDALLLEPDALEGALGALVLDIDLQPDAVEVQASEAPPDEQRGGLGAVTLAPHAAVADHDA